MIFQEIASVIGPPADFSDRGLIPRTAVLKIYAKYGPVVDSRPSVLGNRQPLVLRVDFGSAALEMGGGKRREERKSGVINWRALLP